MGSKTEADGLGMRHWSQQYKNTIDLKENWKATENDKLEAPPQWGWMAGMIDKPIKADPPKFSHDDYEMYIATAFGAFVLAVIARVSSVAEGNYASYFHQFELLKYTLIALFTALQ
eukprot:sb/3476580/